MVTHDCKMCPIQKRNAKTHVRKQVFLVWRFSMRSLQSHLHCLIYANKFNGKDCSTPQVWIYSARKQVLLRLQ